MLEEISNDAIDEAPENEEESKGESDEESSDSDSEEADLRELKLETVQLPAIAEEHERVAVLQALLDADTNIQKDA